MIAAEVKTHQFYLRPDGMAAMIEEQKVEEWCLEMIGAKAEFRDQVSDLLPWTYSHSNKCITWYFAREELATMFRLRWL